MNIFEKNVYNDMSYYNIIPSLPQYISITATCSWGKTGSIAPSPPPHHPEMGEEIASYYIGKDENQIDISNFSISSYNWDPPESMTDFIPLNPFDPNPITINSVNSILYVSASNLTNPPDSFSGFATYSNLNDVIKGLEIVELPIELQNGDEWEFIFELGISNMQWTKTAMGTTVQFLETGPEAIYLYGNVIHNTNNPGTVTTQFQVENTSFTFLSSGPLIPNPKHPVAINGQLNFGENLITQVYDATFTYHNVNINWTI